MVTITILIIFSRISLAFQKQNGVTFIGQHLVSCSNCQGMRGKKEGGGLLPGNLSRKLNFMWT